ncbi:MAG TPA: fatty acid desaturase [Pirellulales bacterium]|nr:fatty acid desaturase [Pirellulales bacterium]
MSNSRFDADQTNPLMPSASDGASAGTLAPPAHRRRKKRKAAGKKTRRTEDQKVHWDMAHRWDHGLDWPVVIWIVAIHLGLLAAPFFFTWKAVALMAFLHWLTGGIGVCLGYHRQLTHGSFSTYRPIRFLLALLGGLSGEGSAVSWVANHRKHHVFSDQEGDPHSPRNGGTWSHMLWFMPNFGRKYTTELQRRYAPDLVKEPAIQWLHKMFLPSHLLFGVMLLAIGWLGWDWYTGLSFVVWGMFVRLVGVLHVTWFVNSASHIWGYRNYETTDDSRNLWWVGLLAYGEGWHNNHHAFQRMARHGHKWWEIDMTYWTILVMEKFGLAWDVVHDVPARQKLLPSPRCGRD